VSHHLHAPARTGRWRQRAILAVLACGSVAAQVGAQSVIRLWPGAAPGSERWTQRERTLDHTPLGRVVIDVVTPTLTAYLPERARATGTAVIVAPGGGFVALALELEGTTTAQWLQRRGIAAFVLEYRTVEKTTPGIPAMDMDTAGRYGIADGIRAIAVVRTHAQQYHVDPDRVGILGFSAGAMVASGALLQRDAAARPAFAAMLYGGPFGVMPPIPSGLPPTFLAWAKDDGVALGAATRLRDALRAAGATPEVHIYERGGHGFGMKRQGTDSDHWIEDFYRWIPRRESADRRGVGRA
jgi:acetyl esterase/lipase